MQIEINGKRNITLDFNAPKKFRLTQNGAEIPYVRTGKNSFRLSKNIDGVVDLEEIIEQPRYMQPVQLQPQQMTVINPQDVERLNEAVRQMALVNPNDVMIINQTAEQLEKNQNFIAQTQKEITDNQVYIDKQQQILNESALDIKALETNNSQRLDSAETAIYSLAGEVENTKSAVIDGLNATLGKIEQQGTILQAEIDTKADKEELESLKKDIEEKSDRFSSAMANYSGGTAYDTLPQGGEGGQILAKRTDRQGDYIWIDQTPVIVKSETIPTASEKYKGEVYQYVGETSEYTHGYIYECQQNGTSYEWVRLDVQPNTAVWGQITGTLIDQTDLQEALDDKQDKLNQTQMDAVNSGANQSNIAQITTNKTNITTINSKIPAQASSSNQLADKEFVNSSISTNTAYFIGTFNSVAELDAYSGALTNNDYAFVVRKDAQGNTVYDRYKYTDATTPPSWVFEYTLNNSSFTASQWQAINSGITDNLVDEFKAKGASLDYANDVLSLEDSEGNVLSSVTIQASAAADGKSITKNSSDELQTIGVVNQNDTTTAIKTWTGTKAQYDAIVTKDANTEYFCTDTDELYLGTVKIGDADLNNKANINLDNSTVITNCITEIPQDIKLELKDGTLTLKAGSKLHYYNNGWKTYITTGDKVSSSTTSGTKQIMIFAAKADGSLQVNGTMTLDNCGSGSTVPSDGSFNAFFNTTDNLMYYYGSKGWIAWPVALPIAIISITDGVITSIDQVFNGFGYIGSTVFALPGVKGLIPNGRNADGSLKNIEFTTSTLLTRTGSAAAVSNWVYGTNGKSLNVFNPSSFIYNENKNIIYDIAGNKISDLGFAIFSTDSTGRITSFTPKTAFHALDYNDRETVVGWGTPNYNAGYTVSSGFTASKSGFLKVSISSNYPTIDIFVNNVQIVYFRFEHHYTNQVTYLIPIAKGDVVIFNGSSAGGLSATFFPMKGA